MKKIGAIPNLVLVAELNAEGVANCLGRSAMAAAGVAHENEHILGAICPDLVHLHSALLLLPEHRIVIVAQDDRPGDETVVVAR